MVKVKSSNIEAIGYLPSERVLRIKFLSGQVFDYLGVPACIFDELLKAESLGKYFSAHIKGRFNYHKQEAPAYCRTCAEWTPTGYIKAEEKKAVGRCCCKTAEHYDKERLETDSACKKYSRDVRRLEADGKK